MANTAVATKTENTALVAGDFDDFLLEDQGAGTDTIGKDDRSVPYIGIVEGLSGSVKKSNEKYNADARVGDMVNNVTGQLYKADVGFDAVVVTYQTRYTEWYPHGSPHGKGIVQDYGTDATAYNNTPEDAQRKRMTNRGTEMVKSGDYVVFIINRETGAYSPAIVSMAKSRFGSARKLNSQISDDRVNARGQSVKPPIFYRIWNFTTKSKTNDGNEWNVYETKMVGSISDLPNGAEIRSAAKEFQSQIAAGAVNLGTNPEHASQDDGGDIPF